VLYLVFVLLCNYKRFYERVQKYLNTTEKIKLLRACVLFICILTLLWRHIMMKGITVN